VTPQGNTTRFPNGMKALGDYMHSKGIKYALYTAESPTTCAGYPASAGHEKIDAMTFASWGADYLKVRALQCVFLP
jgi:alpha-galactosidase